MSERERDAFVGDEGEEVLAEELLEEGEGPEDDDDDFDEEGGAGQVEGMDDDDYIHDEAVHVFEGHEDSVYAVAWSPVSPNVVATGGGDDKAFLWKAQIGEFNEDSLQTFELTGHTDTVLSVAFNADGSLLATGGMDGKVLIWEVATGKKVCTLEGPGDSLEWIQWHPRGNVIAAGAADMTTWMWNAQNAQCMQVFTGHSDSVICGQFTPDGKSLVTGSGDGTVRVWNPRTGECSLTLQGHTFHQGAVNCLDISADSSVVISGGADSDVKLTNFANNKAHIIGTLKGHEDSVTTIGFSKVHPMAASAGCDGKAIIWDLNNLQPRGVCQCDADVLKLKWQPNGPCFYTVSADAIVQMWDSRTGQCVSKQTGHEDAVMDIALSPDGRFAITGSDDKTSRIWDFAGEGGAHAGHSH